MGLSFREKLQKSVKKGGLSNDELHHPSRAYERHFEGYLETCEPVPGKKRSKSVRTYVDSFWIQELSAGKRIGLCVLFVVLFLLSLVPYVYSATRLIQANMTWFVTAPQALSLFALGWTALCLYRYCAAPKKMTVRQHRLAVTYFHRASCAAWIALALMAIAYIIYAVMHPTDRVVTLTCALLSLLSCICILVLFLVEHSVKYTEQENPLARE